MDKNIQQKAVVGVLLTAKERHAVKSCAQRNCRKITDQIRLYIREGLERDGYGKEVD